MNQQGSFDIAFIVFWALTLVAAFYFGVGAKNVHLRRHQRTVVANKNLHIEELAGKLAESRKENVQLMERAQTSFESGRASGLIDGRNQGYEAAAVSYEAEIKELQARYDRAQHGNVIDLTDRIMNERAQEQRSRANHPSAKTGGQ